MMSFKSAAVAGAVTVVGLLSVRGATGFYMQFTASPQSAWRLVRRDASPVTVAVIDTGLDWNHQNISWENIWRNPKEIPDNGIDDDNNGYIDDIHGWDFYDNDNNPMDGNSHGTHVAGTICAEGNNELGVVGVVWHCKIMSLRFMGPNGGFSSAVVDALGYLVAKQVKTIHTVVLVDRVCATLPIHADVSGMKLQVEPGRIVECHVPPYEPTFQIVLVQPSAQAQG